MFLKKVTINNDSTIATNINNDNIRSVEDAIICPREEPFEIVISQELLSSVYLSPDDLDEFLLGHLYYLGLIDNKDDIASYQVCTANKFRVTLSEEITKNIIDKGGIVPYYHSLQKIMWGDIVPIRSKHKYTYQDINKVIDMTDKSISNNAPLHMYYSTHINEISEENIKKCFKFDCKSVHAIDKTIGATEKLKNLNGILISNGFAGYEAVHRLYKSKIPVGIFSGSPTSSALMLAKKAGITLISHNKSCAGSRDIVIYCDTNKNILPQ